MKGLISAPLSRRWLSGLIVALAAGACERAAVEPLRPPCSDHVLSDRFFSPDSFVPALVEVDDELRDTLARYLEAAKEASWICGRVPTEGYRLFIGGGYGLPAVVASAARTSSGWRVASSKFEGRHAGPAYEVRTHATSEISHFPSAEIRRVLQQAAFWTGPTWQQIEGEGDIVMIEVVDDSDHRAVVQAIPTEEFRDAAALLLRSTTGTDEVLRLRSRSR